MWRISIAVGFRQCWPTPAQTKSNRKSRYWREALNHFTILWPERMPALERVAQRKPRSVSTEIGWGRGTAPFPRPKVLTHLTRPDFFVQLPAGRQGETSRLTPTIYF